MFVSSEGAPVKLCSLHCPNSRVGQRRHRGDGDRDDRVVRAPPASVRAVAPVRLAEAHVSVAVSLRHARVVHDEVVHLEVVRARPPHLVVL